VLRHRGGDEVKNDPMVNTSALFCTVPVWCTYIRCPGEYKEQGPDSQGEYSVHAGQVGVGIDVSKGRERSGSGRGMWISGSERRRQYEAMVLRALKSIVDQNNART
jgi:hypothetical protein